MQQVNEATRITSNSSTLIDHFITNEPKKIPNVVLYTLESVTLFMRLGR